MLPSQRGYKFPGLGINWLGRCLASWGIIVSTSLLNSLSTLEKFYYNMYCKCWQSCYCYTMIFRNICWSWVKVILFGLYLMCMRVLVCWFAHRLLCQRWSTWIILWMLIFIVWCWPLILSMSLWKILVVTLTKNSSRGHSWV